LTRTRHFLAVLIAMGIQCLLRPLLDIMHMCIDCGEPKVCDGECNQSPQNFARGAEKVLGNILKS